MAGGVLPDPFFDTQVAADGLGNTGTRSATRRWSGRSPWRSISESSRFTDGSRRPLSAAQITYALADVTFLRQIYQVLARLVEETGAALGGRRSWRR